MFFADIQTMNAAAFKRLTGVAPEVFTVMVEVIAASDRAFGRPSKLSHADQVLATLMCWWSM
jgi:hypothetical protein